jgi:hypothetical protein
MQFGWSQTNEKRNYSLCSRPLRGGEGRTFRVLDFEGVDILNKEQRSVTLLLAGTKKLVCPESRSGGKRVPAE